MQVIIFTYLAIGFILMLMPMVLFEGFRERLIGLFMSMNDNRLICKVSLICSIIWCGIRWPILAYKIIKMQNAQD